ncbi:AAA family ATPase [Massilibacteroides sp.]|uniref:AAA family ATPase n=1 Tax=Massilibacteroides sp. TaxID=2034766 RepID=UPI0026059AAB|nr:AAA family ATPase [Massilibacteroides sp.]MDD4515505.1 SbcC/MukB-like Walker B domain-containing protein [Massilibacteroides sp.]
MKILAIRGKNIASLEGEFAVDFTTEPLVSANIFAISGPTGSGKSSLLDTMCLALFARTPRTDQAKELNVRLKDVSDDALVQSDPRFLLRRGTASGYAETDFVALSGQRYRARWSVSRAREKENGRLQNPRVSLFNIDKEEEEQGTRSELQQKIADLIGLSFEQFTRSVLLAQNDFSTFLKAEQGEKAALLEKLTGTELYSRISKRIYEKNAEARTAFEITQTQIAGIELLSEEDERILNRQAKETEALLKLLEQYKKEWNTLNEAVNSTSLLLKKKETEKKEAEERWSKALHLREKTEIVLDVETKAAAALEQSLKELQPQLIEARKLDTELVNATKLLTDHSKRLAESERKNNEAQKKVQTITSSLKQGETERASITDWFVKFKSKEKIATQLPSLLLHLDAAERTRTVIEKARQEEKKVKQEIERLTKEAASFSSLLKKREEDMEQLNLQRIKTEEELNTIDTLQIEQQKELILTQREQLLQEQLLFSSVGNDAKELRSKLTDNTPCPVCGSIDHPFATKEVHERMQEIQLRIIALTQQSNTIDKQLKDIAERRKQLDKLRELLVRVTKELSETEKSQNDLNNNITVLSNRLQQLLDAQTEQNEELDRALSATNNLFDNIHWQEKWMENPVDFRQRLSLFVSEWQSKEKRVRELEQLLSGLKSELISYTTFSETLQKELSVVKEEFNKQNETCRSLQEKRNYLLNGKAADQVETEHLNLIDAKKTQIKQLQQTLAEQSGIAEQSRGQKEQISKDLLSLTETLKTAQTSLEDWLTRYHETSEGLLPEERWSKTLELKTGIDFRLKAQEANKKRIAGLKKDADQKQKISDQWAKLNELAGSADGAKFRRIAQSYTLDILLSYANVQLQSLTNRYRLERVPDTLALQVIDRDMCDEIRTVHSLSGGESFLVSLALALGLSSLSSNRMKVESLFIDEGFGSLDTETLRTAMDALENLRTQGRKIGVISHVQEMTERIPTQIRINRLGNGRSGVEVM